MKRKPRSIITQGTKARASGRTHIQALDAGQMIQWSGRWRDSLNPLRGLSPYSLTLMVEEAKRGAQSDYQWLLSWIEDEDAVYGAIVERSLASLSGLDWDVLIPEHLEGADKAQAEAQQLALKEYYTSQRGLRESIEEMGMARFRGNAFLEKCFVDGVPCMDPVPQEHFVRDGRFGEWRYNAAANSGTVDGVPLDPDKWVIREYRRPVGRKAARLYVIKTMTLKDWQGFADVYGIPALFAVMPPDVQEADRLVFQNIMNKVASDARGALPHGSDIKTVEAKTTGNSPFKELADWCDSQLVIAGTGGLLTMLSMPGSGTLAGGAHQEAFDLLAAREAALVSEIFQDQVDRPFLAKHFPGQPVLAYWQLAAAEEKDPDKVVTHAKTLHDAGYRIELDQLKEKTGYELEEITPEEPDDELDPDKDDKEPPDITIKNRNTGRRIEYVTAQDEARRAIASALNEDFEGVRGLFEELAEADPASPEYAALLERAQNAVDLLSQAPPGTLKADTAFADLAAAGLLEGWSTPPGQ